jgi:hypothetical protein
MVLLNPSPEYCGMNISSQNKLKHAINLWNDLQAFIWPTRPDIGMTQHNISLGFLELTKFQMKLNNNCTTLSKQGHIFYHYMNNNTSIQLSLVKKSTER